MATAVDSSSSRSKLGSVLKGGRRKGPSADNSDREENSSTTTTSERRNSADGATATKIQSHSRPSSCRSSESSNRNRNRNRKLSVLLKRRKKQPGTRSAAPSQQDEGLGHVHTGNSSTNDLGLEDNASSSLLTEDSEESRPVRPSLSPHHSHAGYLTLTSPSIQAELVDTDDSVPPVPPLPDISADSPFLTKSATLGAPPSSARRSPSPAGRLREAFAPIRKLSSSNLKESSPSNSPAPSGDGESGGKLKSLISRGRKGSTSSRRDSRVVEERPATAPSGPEKPQPRKSPLPTPIVTEQPSTPPRDHFDGPTTVITPPTPTGPRADDQTTPTPGGKKEAITTVEDITPPARAASPPIRGHSRNKSSGAGPSKLSNAIVPPLTPALEEIKTPGGTLVAPSATSGFFSSMFSAAQNAATSLTNTITSSTSTQRSRSGTGSNTETEVANNIPSEEVIPHTSAVQQASDPGEKPQLAIDTLGSGNLSLSQLGIVEGADSTEMTSKPDGLEHPQVSALRKDELSSKADDDAAARAVSMAYSEKTNGEKSTAPSGISTPGEQPKPQPDEPIPTKSLVEPESGSIKRAGSVRSRLSGSRRRRTRGSSAATGTTAATVQPNGVHRPQGFAVANQKRNRDFHNLFKSVPEDDLLIEDYSAALQREILLHGRLYVSEGHICFSSNILGWVTNLVIGLDEVISVEKKSTAVIFQNGIVISTMHARNVFASLLNRDATYELIISMWKITHPNLKSTLNGNAVEGGGTGDKTEKAESVADGESASEEVYDEDDTTDDGDADKSMDAVGDESLGASEDADEVKAVSRKTSAAVGGALANGTAKAAESPDSAIVGAAVTVDFPGPPSHDATDCGDAGSHYDKLLIDATIPAPLGKIYSMMFGPAMGTFMRRWLIEDQKSTNLQLEDDKKGLGTEKKEMSFSYIKPLSGGIGPKQTTCNINMTLEQFDLDKAVSVACSTQNPDVPSGNAFVTKTRYCLMWAPSNSTRLIMNYTIEWSGKSWIKGPIEKGTADGQLQYAKDLVAALKAAVTAKSILKAGAKGKGRGAKRRRDTIEEANVETELGLDGTAGVKPGQKALGILESRSTLRLAIAICVLLGIIMFLVGRLSTPSYGRVLDPYRSARYERIWASEENDLWAWLEERVGLENSAPAILPSNSGGNRKERSSFGRNAKDMQRKLATEKMNERQVIEAIEITRRRLEVLEEAVKRNRPASTTSKLKKQEASGDAKQQLV